jgi:ADP-ribosylglycohydrolase
MIRTTWGERKPNGNEFLRAVIALLPESETRQGIVKSLEIAPMNPEEAARQLGTGKRVSSQDTVPYCLWCAAHHHDDYEGALWTTVAGGGDRDTTCAIVGGIVALSAKDVPETWLQHREPLPPGFESSPV